jgi:hypothetical protein
MQILQSRQAKEYVFLLKQDIMNFILKKAMFNFIKSIVPPEDKNDVQSICDETSLLIDAVNPPLTQEGKLLALTEHSKNILKYL